MIALPAGTRIWLAAGVTDMRCGFQALAAKVHKALEENPLGGDLYIFRGRRGDLVKLLWATDDGLWLLAKRLEASRFIWPDNKAEVVTMTTNVLHALLDGDDITTIRRHPRQEYLRVS
jgi:transposase